MNLIIGSFCLMVFTMVVFIIFYKDELEKFNQFHKWYDEQIGLPKWARVLFDYVVLFFKFSIFYTMVKYFNL